MTSEIYRTLQHRMPRLYLRLAKRSQADMHRVSEGSDLAIVGYPGSANSYARMAFLHVNPEAKIASHTHVWSELADAVALHLPALLLVRDPAHAVASRMARFGNISARAALLDYARFHERVLPWRNDIVVADFTEVTTGFGAVVDRLNERFGTTFVRFPHEDSNTVDFLHLLLGGSNGAVPSPERRPALQAALNDVNASELSTLRRRCADAYAALLA